MKNRKLLVILSLSIFISCSKSKEEATSQEATSLFEIFEYKTNTPVSSVRINLLRCSYYDLVFGCQATEIVSTGLTDNNGRYSFKQSELNRSNQGIKLHKSNYWDAGGNPGINYIAPESWISIHLIRQNVYSFPRLFFRYDINGESGNARINPFTVPFDTIIKVRAFGNQVNRVNWQIGSGISSSYISFNNYSVTPILANGILTQSPDRFGTTSITLTY
jgi:hypothetical protein